MKNQLTLTTLIRQVLNFLNVADNAFSNLDKVPAIVWLFMLTTIAVLPIPMGYIFAEPVYFSYKDLASEFIAKHPEINNSLLFFHVLAAIFSILTGPFLFIHPYRKAYPAWHRRLGKIYISGCMISAITIVPLAWHNSPGTIARYGFTPMAIIWFFTSYFAYTAAINKNFVTHRRWAMRSYAMTVAFLHVNLTFKHLVPMQDLTLDGQKAMNSMVSWLSGLMIVELYLAGTTFGGRYLGLKKWAKNLTRLAPEDIPYWSYKRPINKIET